MIATAILKEEHRLIVAVLDAMEKWIDELRDGKAFDPRLATMIGEFLRDFADACHHGKEEEKLFVWMRDHSVGEGAVHMLEEDHEIGRAHVRAMLESAQSGERTSSQRFCSNGMDLAAMLRTHIAREDEGVFAMADMAADREDELLDEFLEIEAGHSRHASAFQLAQDICRTIGVRIPVSTDVPTLGRVFSLT